MRSLIFAAAILGVAAPSYAETTAPAPVAAAATYTSATTPIGVLLDDPAAKAVLEKIVPPLVENPQIEMARSLTLKQVQQFSDGALTDELLAEIDAELAKLPAK